MPPTIQHSLPGAIVIASPLGVDDLFNFNRFTPPTGGPSYESAFSKRRKHAFGLSISDMRSTTTAEEEWESFLQHIASAGQTFWFRDNVSKVRRHIFCGYGDGSRLTFPLGMDGLTSADVFVDGRYESSTTIEAVANLYVSDESANPQSAIAHEAAGTGLATGNLSLFDGFSADGLNCILADPTGSGANHEVFPSEYVSVTIGEEYTGHVAVRKSTSTEEIFKARISWYDSVPSLLSSDDSATITGLYSSWRTATVTATAPASAVYARISAIRTTSSALNFFAACYGICRRDLDLWWLPSRAPSTITFSTAPSLGDEVTAKAEGFPIRWVFLVDNPSWESWYAGDIVIDSFSVEECWRKLW